MKYSVIIPYYDSPELRFALDSYSHYFGHRDDTEIIIVEASENYFSKDLHKGLKDLIDKYKDSIKIRAVIDPSHDTSIHSKYLLGAKIATGELVMLTTALTVPNFDFFEIIDHEILYKTCIVCGCVGVRLLEDRGTFFNSDFVFDRWYQHSEYIDRVYNFCCIMNRQDYITLEAFNEDKFLDELENRGIVIWARDDLYVHIINYPAGFNEYKNVYEILYRESDYDDLERSDNARKWEIISKLISDIEFNNMVDLGCGRGYYLNKLLEMEKEVLGVELSAICCEKYLGELPHVCSSIDDFCAEKNRTFDLVLCMDVMEHIDPGKIDDMIEGIRSLSGTAIFGVANHKDVMLGFDLHLTIEGPNWWEDKFSKYYKNVETLIFSEKFYFFKCTE